MEYQGFEIYLGYGRKPTSNKKRYWKSKMGEWFAHPPWWVEDNEYRTLIHYENIDSYTQIIFPEENTEEEKSRGLDKYGMKVQSIYPGLLRTRNINLHKQLCEEILHKIPWQKQAFYLIDGKLIPV